MMLPAEQFGYSPTVLEFWSFPLECSQDQETAAEKLVSADERDRAGRFRFARHRRRFLVRRAMRRVILADRLQTPLEDLTFIEEEHGRPVVAEAGNDFSFNASHSGDCGVVVTGVGRLGIDVEDMRRRMDYRQFADRKFTTAESTEIGRHSDDTLARVFFNCWTGKEAYIKALGQGLQKDLQSFSVACSPEQPPGLEWEASDDDAPGEWSFRRLVSGSLLVTIAMRSEPPEDLSIKSLDTDSIMRESLVRDTGEVGWQES